MSGFKDVYVFFPDIEKTRVVEQFFDVREPYFWEVFEACKAYSLVSIERFYNVYKTVEYVAARGVPGDFAECGVFLGGTSMAMHLFAAHFGIPERRIYMYDTFQGFAEGIVEIVGDREETLPPLPDFSDSVEENITRLGLPRDRFELVKGPVEETLRHTLPTELSVLRLDTDYYESTRVELEVLYPRLAREGVLIVDDYGHYEGARKAVDEYVAEHAPDLLMNRIDYGCRSGIKL